LPCLTVINPRYVEGMNTSLSAGISALPAGPAAAVAMLADMPFVTAAMVRELVSRRRGSTVTRLSTNGRTSTSARRKS